MQQTGEIVTAYPSWTPAPRPGLVPLRPLSFGTILGRSFTALRHNPRVLLGFAMSAQIVAYLVLLVATGAVAVATFSRLETIPESSDDFGAVLAGSVAITAATGLVLGLASTALTVVVQGVVVADVAHGVVAEKPSLGALWRRVRPAFWRLLGYTLLAAAAVVVAMGLVVLALVAISTAVLALGIVLTVMCVLGAIPLFLWLTTKLLLVPAVLVLEGSGVFPAIARSWRLTRTRFWPVLGVWILIQLTFGVLAQIVSAPLSLPGGVLSAVIAPTGDADPVAAIGIVVTAGLTQIVTLLIQSVALVVLSAATALLYVDARMRHEGLDLDLQSYVEQRQAGAGQADPYRWHIGRAIGPRPGYGLAAPYAPQPPAQYAPPPYPPAPQQPYPPTPQQPYPPTPQQPPAPPSPTDWTAPGGDDR